MSSSRTSSTALVRLFLWLEARTRRATKGRASNMYLRSKLKSLWKFLVAACCVVVACPATAADRDASAGYELYGQNISVRFQVVQDGLKLAEVKDRRTGAAPHDLRAGHGLKIILKPFEVLTLDAEPQP
jgi:hypothetical protein